MKTNWDYTGLAEAYLNRPDYSSYAIDNMIKIMGLKPGNKVADIGAGVAHLTLHLLRNGLDVIAIEPNNDMRNTGINRTNGIENLEWIEATCENTNQKSAKFDAVFYGSSFNVCDKNSAFDEAYRILKKNGWIAIMFNHRDLEDNIQKEIEQIIFNYIPDYDYGSRRIDQTFALMESIYFREVLHINSIVLHKQSINDVITAWRSHATLKRQAGKAFERIVDEIESYLLSLGCDSIEIPYRTNIWISQVNK